MVNQLNSPIQETFHISTFFLLSHRFLLCRCLQKERCSTACVCLGHSVERSQAELLKMNEMGQHSAEHKAEGMIRELELELTELRKRSAEMGKLAQRDDYISRLKSLKDSHANQREELRKLPEICLSAITDLSPLKVQPNKEMQEYAAM
ncbi:hypothetical protein PHYPO_G00193490 [Pangasianodon hypophthalmus]|uniref:TRIM8/14/16/25/29/45/65 coiled-coil region domain-containing protein n=1 Tax=Pangasianodon hypophthalmus TaxID=310915 RepID=A0A5N5PK64_PANHP|nr:hypothetical protein PHYPO_G00193490 [Pangasianodon hypophthalmus]